MKFLIAFICAALFFSGCNNKDAADLDVVLFGTWQVSQVEGQQYLSGRPGTYLVDNNPSGFITFHDDGTGQQNYTFTLFGSTYPNQSAFSWTATQNEILIDRLNEPDMVWYRLTNLEHMQEAYYVINVSGSEKWHYTLTLTR